MTPFLGAGIALAGLLLSVLTTAVWIGNWGGSIKLQILEAERRAKHDAIDAVSAAITLKANHARVRDLERRILALETRSHAE